MFGIPPCGHSVFMLGCSLCKKGMEAEYKKGWKLPDNWGESGGSAHLQAQNPPQAQAQGETAPVLGNPLIMPNVGHKWRGTFPEVRQRAITILIAHLNTPELLEISLPLWELQTLKPYIIIIDTGSTPANIERLERLRSATVEIHYIKSHGWIHSSAPVGAAMDLGFSLVATKFAYTTHSDVFPRRRDFLEWMAGQCNAVAPVVGWQMSERASGPWADCVSHTNTIWLMDTYRTVRPNWNFVWWYAKTGYPEASNNGVPDTEFMPNFILWEWNIRPHWHDEAGFDWSQGGPHVKLLGAEPNWAVHRTEWFDHARSNTVLRAYTDPTHDKHQKMLGYTGPVLEEARERLKKWRGGENRLIPCVYLGKSPPPKVLETLNPRGRDWRICEAGRGIVCPCMACKTCELYESENGGAENV